MAAHPGRRTGIAGIRVAAWFVFVLAGLPGIPGAPGPAGEPAYAQTQSQPARTSAGPAASLLPTQAEKERFHHLAEELRCLVCQNQTLADSDAELAADLRREVEQLMLEGRSDAEIKAWLVDRYGDFVLYRPPLQRNTWFLWLGPFALLVVGGMLWWRVLVRHRERDDGGMAAGHPAGTKADMATRKPVGEDGGNDVQDAATARARQLLKDS